MLSMQHFKAEQCVMLWLNLPWGHPSYIKELIIALIVREGIKTEAVNQFVNIIEDVCNEMEELEEPIRLVDL